MNWILIAIPALLTLSLLLMKPARASAHCDTMDGPTVKDALKALKTGQAELALKWVEPDDEKVMREAFALARKVRVLGPDAKELAERYFLDTLVRVHRAAEGEGFTGIKPYGQPMDAKVAAADKSIELGSLEPIKALFAGEELHALEEKFHAAMALKDYDPTDLDAARRYIAAYVSFFKFAEGEAHAHGGHHGHH